MAFTGSGDKITGLRPGACAVHADKAASVAIGFTAADLASIDKAYLANWVAESGPAFETAFGPARRNLRGSQVPLRIGAGH